jgi:hypothetical protein
MIYEIRSKKMLGGSASIGYYYFNKENAEKTCQQLNELMNVYFVSPVEMKDTL